MAIQPFNTLQNKKDTNLSENVEKYVIEALANLGQRYSVAGDGISTDSITFSKIVSNNSYADPTKYLGKIWKDENNNICLGIAKIENNLNIIEEVTKSIPLYNHVALYIDDTNPEESFNLTVKSPEKNVDTLTHIHMYADNNYFVYSAKENIIKDNDEGEIDEEKSRFVCEKYNITTETLDTAIRIAKIEDTYKILYMSKMSENEESVNYSLRVYGIEFDEYFTFEDLLEHKFKVNEIDNGEINPEYWTNFNPETILNDIYTQSEQVGRTSQYIEVTDNSLKISVVHSKNDKSFRILSINDETQESLYEKPIQWFAYDYEYMYRQLKKAYSKDIYLEDGVNTIMQHVLVNLYLLSGENILYVPVDYEFNYAYNTNNDYQVYFSTSDISVRNLTIKTNTKNILDSNDNIGIYSLDSKVEKITFYNYQVEYDDRETISKVIVSKHFVLPYINESGYWVINDVDTEIYARGRNAGNPNVIIYETKNGQIKPNILVSADKDYIEGLNYVEKSCYIKIPNKVTKTDHNGHVTTEITSPFTNEIFSDNTTDTSAQYIIFTEEDVNKVNPYIKCNVLVPTLNNTSKKVYEENIEKLKYSVIINLSEVESIYGFDDPNAIELNNVIRKVYTNGKIASIWSLQEDDTEHCGYGFKPVIVDKIGTLDFIKLTNFDNLISWVIDNYVPTDPDNFLFTRIVFDRTDSQTKNNDNQLIYCYPTIESFNIKTSNVVTNSTNLRIAFYDQLTSENYIPDPNEDPDIKDKSTTYSITAIGQDDLRYFDKWVNHNVTTELNNEQVGQYQVSNEMYGYNSNQYELEYVPSDVNYQVPTFDLSETLVKDENVMNKVSILSFSPSYMPYNAYIGTVYNEIDKSVLTIGTSEINPNIGHITMMNDKDSIHFNKHRQININFDNTRISAYAYIGNDLITEKDTISYHTTWRRRDSKGTTYWTTHYHQFGCFYPKPFVLSIDEYQNTYIGISNNSISVNDKETFLEYCNEHESSFMCGVVKERYKLGSINNEQEPITRFWDGNNDNYASSFYIYINDLLIIDKLMYDLNPTLKERNLTFDVKSSNTVIKSYDNKPFAIILNSTLLNEFDEYEYNWDNETLGTIESTILNNSSYTSNRYLSNDLTITYYEANNTCFVNITENDSSSFMTYLHKLEPNYNIIFEDIDISQYLDDVISGQEYDPDEYEENDSDSY